MDLRYVLQTNILVRTLVLFLMVYWGSLYHSKNDLFVYALSLFQGSIYDSDIFFNMLQIIALETFGSSFVLTFLQILILILIAIIAKGKDQFTFFAILISTAFITTYFNAIRSGLALFFVIAVFELFSAYKIRVKLILSLLAVFLHQSAIILIGMYVIDSLFNNSKYSINKMILNAFVFIVLGIIFIIYLPMVYERYQLYFTAGNVFIQNRYGHEKLIYWYVIIIVCILLYTNRDYKLNKLNEILPIIFLTFFCTLLSIKFGVNELISRLLLINNFWLLIMLFRNNKQKNFRRFFVAVSLFSPSSFGILL